MSNYKKFECFNSIIGALHLRDGFIVPIVHAYFDESGTHAGSPVLCVAGYAFWKRDARLLSKEWEKVLNMYNLPYFHMVDCAHGNKLFSNLSLQQRIDVSKSLIEIVKNRAAIGFAVSVDTSAYNELMPEWAPAKSAYAFCARCVIDEMGKWFYKTNFHSKSAYFFEAGHESRAEAEQLIVGVLNNPFNTMKDVHYGYVAHSFIQKEEAPAVQAADILAWQWATDIKHKNNAKPRRKDFANLLAKPVRGCHFDRNRIIGYLEILKGLKVDRNKKEYTTEELALILHASNKIAKIGLDM